MSRSPDPVFDPVATVAAAGAAAWRVLAGGRFVEVRGIESADAHKFAGSWTVDEFLRQFDGLHRLELKSSLTGAGGPEVIDLSVQMAAGGYVHFRGVAGKDGSRSGVLVVPPALALGGGTQAIEPAYQPIVRLRDSTIAGYECLARVRQTDGSISAVNAGMPVLGIGPQMAAEVRARWAGKLVGEKFLNLNLSACELGDERSVRAIADVVKEFGLERGRFRIELTEQAAIRDWDTLHRAVQRLREAGAGIVLDDFGAGHSSMVWLSELDVDGVKLDSSLLANLKSDRGRLILGGLLEMLARLQVEVVVEGIEDASDVPTLLELGAVLGQGYALGRPSLAPQIDDGSRSG